MAEPCPVLIALRLVRQAHGITQEAVAKAIGASRLSIVRWESGESDPSLASTIAYARLLGLRLGLELAEQAGAAAHPKAED